MLEWIITSILLNLPGWFWLVSSGVGFAAFFFASIFSHIPHLRPYMALVKPVGGLIILGSVFMYGGTEINNIWEERIKKAEAEIAAKEKLADEASEKLAKENADKRRILEEANQKQKELTNKLGQAIAAARSQPGGTKTVTQIVVENLGDEERKKYESMNAEQKAKYEQQIEELVKNSKDCPVVPKFIIDQINQASTNKLKAGEQK